MPVATLNRVSGEDFSWHVPGLREELVAALIRWLPKQLRVSFVPAPNTARAFLAAVPPGEEPLLDALERHLRATTGVVVPREAWDWAKVAEHLRPTFRVRRRGGRASRRAARTSRRSRSRCDRSSRRPWRRSPATRGWRTGQTAWTFGTIAAEQTGAAPATRWWPTRRWSTRATRWGWRSAAPSRRRTPGTGSASPGLLLLARRGPTWWPGSTTPASWRWPARRTPGWRSSWRTVGRAVVLAEVDARLPVRDEPAYAELAAARGADLEPRLPRCSPT